MGRMTVADTMIAAVAAGGGLGGIAAVISALRPPSAHSVQRSPVPSHVPPSWRRAQDARAGTAGRPASRVVFWSLGPGVCACLLAGALVAVVGRTTMSLSQPPIVVLTMATAACAGVTIWGSGRLLGRAVGESRTDLVLYAGAGLVVALAALAATLIAGAE
jgi:hypothetical protein